MIKQIILMGLPHPVSNNVYDYIKELEASNQRLKTFVEFETNCYCLSGRDYNRDDHYVCPRCQALGA